MAMQKSHCTTRLLVAPSSKWEHKNGLCMKTALLDIRTKCHAELEPVVTDPFPQGPPPAPNTTGSDWNATGKREAIEYNLESDTYRVSFDSDDSVSMAVVSTVAVVSETEPMELPPLYSVCDPEALETVVQPAIHGPSNNDVHVRFTFNDCTVTVHNYGIITVQPPEAGNGGPEGEQKTE